MDQTKTSDQKTLLYIKQMETGAKGGVILGKTQIISHVWDPVADMAFILTLWPSSVLIIWVMGKAFLMDLGLF